MARLDLELPISRFQGAQRMMQSRPVPRFMTKLLPTALVMCAAMSASASAAAAAAAAPDRAYEQVSPVQKFGNSVDQYTTVQAAVGGGAVAYASSGAFADAVTSISGGYYIARRGSDSWTSHAVDAPQDNTVPVVQTGRASLFFTDTLSATVQFSQLALADGAIAGGGNLYYRDNSSNERRTLVATQGSLFAAEQVTLTDRPPVGATPDLGHVVLRSLEVLAPGGTYNRMNVYELADGGARLVNRLPDGSVLPEGATLPSGLRPVSEDGKRIYFASPPQRDFGALYVRTGGADTRLISYSRRAGDSTEATPANFMGASADGSVVYFVSAQTIGVDDPPGAANNALYRYDVTTDELTNLSVVTDPADSIADVQSVSYVSRDGSAVFFTASSKLAPGASSGSPNFYVWRNGEIRFINDVGAAELTVSPDERYMAFRASGPDASSACGGPCPEIFRYDAVTNDLKCVSCRDAGEGNRGSTTGPQDKFVSNHTPQAVVDDGSVMFTSSEALVAGDVNGRRDVYEYGGGTLALVSPGTGGYDAVFVDASADGRDIFFVTAESLVAQDNDAAYDLYDARVGGGLAAQNVRGDSQSECEGDACQAPGPPAPTLAPPGVAGGGDVRNDAAAAVRPRLGLSLKARRGRAGLSLTAVTNVRGRILVSGAATRQVRSPVRNAGRHVYGLVLSKAARRKLSRDGRYKVTVRVTFESATGRKIAKSVSATLRA
jgi:hypothetical protein